MKVSPRVASSPEFACFTEMRFVRYSELSLEAALLFHLLEEAAIYRRKSVRKAIKKLCKHGQDYVQFLCRSILKGRMTKAEMLAAWNSDDFLFSSFYPLLGKTQDRADRLRALCSMGGLDLCPVAPGALRDESKQFPFYFSEQHSTVAVFYTDYDSDNFAVAPCGHIHYCYCLYRQARKAMSSRPMNREQFLRLGLRCSEQCPRDVSEFVFALGERRAVDAATFAASLYEPRASLPADTKNCSVCRTRVGLPVCPMKCLVCQPCAVIAVLSPRWCLCPGLCGKRTPLEKLVRWIREAENIADIIPRNDRLECGKCRKKTNIRLFGLNWSDDSRNFTCDDCAADLQRGYSLPIFCPQVAAFDLESENIPKKHSAVSCFCSPFSAREIQSQREKSACVRLPCEKCSSLKPMSDFVSYLKMVHACLVCETCLGRNRQSALCPKCNAAYSQADIAGLSTSSTECVVTCIRCREVKHASEFSFGSLLSHWWKCKLCDRCILGESKREFCTVCSSAYLKGDLAIIHSLLLHEEDDAPATALCGLPAERRQLGEIVTEDYIQNCEVCSGAQVSSFRSAKLDNHSCLICDFCLFQANESNPSHAICPLCKRKLSASAINAFRQTVSTLLYHCKDCNSSYRVPLKSGQPHVSGCPRCVLRTLNRGLVSDSLCACGNAITPQAIFCPKLCLCSQCVLRDFLLTRKQTCPVCSSELQGVFPYRPQCSACRRELDLMRREVQWQVVAMCPETHVLCCFCVEKRAEDRFQCGVCGASVAVERRKEVEAAQRQVVHGCSCGRSGGKLTQLRCAHLAHAACELTLQRCYLCAAASSRPHPQIASK